MELPLSPWQAVLGDELKIDTPRRLRGDVHLSFEELAEAAGLSAVALGRLVHLGLIEPDVPGTGDFTADAAARLRRMMRVHRDLGVNLTGAAIVVDLLDRIERLEAKLVGHAGR